MEQVHILNVGIVGRGGVRHEQPHKPAMLQAVLDLIATGEVRRRIPGEELRDFFRIHNMNRAAVGPFHPPAGESQDRFDFYLFTGGAGEPSGEVARIALRLLKAMGV